MGTEAMDLLKPDVSPRGAILEEEEDDDLEALRLAALRSMKPKKPQGYQLQPHPRRTNLLTIVVDEDPPKIPSKDPPSKIQDKFSRHKDDENDEKSSSSSSEEEEDVLKLDASAEVDELTQLLDDLEDKVLPKSSSRRPHSKRSSPSPPYSKRRPIKNGKSRSLPPPSSSSSSKKRTEEPRLPTPEREKRLARKKKFQAPLNDKKKVICLKNIKESSLSPPPTQSTPLEDAISLSVEDTLDMFDEEESHRSLKRKQVSLSANTSPSSHKGGVMDLRVQLHKKRQQKRGSNKSHSTGRPSTYIEEQRLVSMEEEDALENAVLESSSEEEGSYPKKPRRVLIREMTSSSTIPSTNESSSSSANKRKTNRPSIMSRLGEPVSEANKRRSPSPDGANLGKSPKKKKEKKEKRKKSKKDKKDKKKGGGVSKSGKSRVSSSGEDDAHNPSDDDEELFKFFEEEEGTGETSSVQDELMKRMEKKNQARLKRLKEIEEDKMLHT